MGSNAHYDEKIPGNGITNARKTMRCRVRCVSRIRPVAPTGHEAWWRGSGGGSETKPSLNILLMRGGIGTQIRVPILVRGILRWATGRRSNRISDGNDVVGPQRHADKCNTQYVENAGPLSCD